MVVQEAGQVLVLQPHGTRALDLVGRAEGSLMPTHKELWRIVCSSRPPSTVYPELSLFEITGIRQQERT